MSKILNVTFSLFFVFSLVFLQFFTTCSAIDRSSTFLRRDKAYERHFLAKERRKLERIAKREKLRNSSESETSTSQNARLGYEVDGKTGVWDNWRASKAPHRALEHP